MFLSSIEAAPSSFREPGDRIALDCTPLHWATHWLGLGACLVAFPRLVLSHRLAERRSLGRSEGAVGGGRRGGEAGLSSGLGWCFVADEGVLLYGGHLVMYPDYLLPRRISILASVSLPLSYQCDDEVLLITISIFCHCTDNNYCYHKLH